MHLGRREQQNRFGTGYENTMWKSEKHLCEIGKMLDANIDKVLEELRKSKDDSSAVYQAIKAYFRHRYDCEKCMVIWKQIKREESKSTTSR